MQKIIIVRIARNTPHPKEPLGRARGPAKSGPGAEAAPNTITPI